MIRPHTGGFCYGPAELNEMCESIERVANAGADGVVFGPLDVRGGVDVVALGRLCERAQGLGLMTTFHRAFDAVPDQLGAIAILIELGIDRVLTTGTRWGSGEGIGEGRDQVRRIIHAAGGRIEVVCAGKIGPGSAGILRPLLAERRVSVHAYSGVLRGGRVDQQLVRDLTKSIDVQDVSSHDG